MVRPRIEIGRRTKNGLKREVAGAILRHPSVIFGQVIRLAFRTRFGTEGCAFATVVAYLTCAGLYVACTHRLLGISFRSGPLFALAPLAVTLLFFIYPGPLFNYAEAAARALFPS